MSCGVFLCVGDREHYWRTLLDHFPGPRPLESLLDETKGERAHALIRRSTVRDNTNRNTLPHGRTHGVRSASLPLRSVARGYFCAVRWSRTYAQQCRFPWWTRAASAGSPRYSSSEVA